MLDLHDKIEDAVAEIKKQWDETPHAGVILGTGLGSLVQEIEVDVALSLIHI